MNDLISRRQAIDAVMECYDNDELFEAYEWKLNELPSIQPEPHWIPVTVEPTDRMICYVTLKDTNDKNRQNWVAEVIYTPWDGFDLMDGIEAIAWMPKQYPEPYKGVTDGRD